jgi:polyisoprenoid-binding protein YceI
LLSRFGGALAALILGAQNKDVRDFAQDMERDHQAVNEKALALVKKLHVTPQDNDTSQALPFRSTKIVPTSKDAAKVTGDLTLHGVTRPVTLDVHFVGAGVNPLDKAYTVGFQATGEISRSEFDVKTYVPLIGDAVQITLSGAFERQG